MFMKTRLLCAALCLTLALGVVPARGIVRAQDTAENILTGCVETYDPEVDYFPQKATIRMAEGLTVEYFNNYKLVTVAEPWAGADPVTYALVQCGTPAPEELDDTVMVVEVPATTLITNSTSYLPFVVELGLLDNLIAHDVFDYVSTEAVREKIDAGEMVAIGEGAGVNVELVLDLDPSLILTQSSDLLEYSMYPPLAAAGLPVVLDGDYMENTPLNRAEWVKFIALFYNREGQAEVIFDDIVTRYEELVALVADVETKPTVFLNSPWDGTWYTPGGQNYMARFLADAGTNYLWADDDSTGSLALDFEVVFEQAADADLWLNANGFWFSLEDALSTDERFAEFAAFQNGAVWAHNARLNEFGGNDFFEGGVANPDLILADLIAIAHPELLPDHEFVYYQHLQ